jgi:WD40 repeat protein
MSQDQSRVLITDKYDQTPRVKLPRSAKLPNRDSLGPLAEGPLFPALPAMSIGDLMLNARSAARFLAPLDRARVFDVATNRLLFTHTRPHDPNNRLARFFSPDGRYLLVVDIHGWDVYDVDTGARRFSERDAKYANGMLLVTNAGFLYVLEHPDAKPPRTEFHLRDFKTGAVRTHVPDPPGGFSFQLSPDGRRSVVTTGGPEPRMRLYDLSTPEFRGADLTPPYHDPSFSPGGRWMVRSVGSELLLWDLDNPGPALRFRGHQGRLASFDVSPDGRRLVVLDGSSGSLRFWDVQTTLELVTLPCPTAARSVRFVGDRLHVIGVRSVYNWIDPSQKQPEIRTELWVLDGTPDR